MSKIVGEEIPSYVAQQINKRQATQGKTSRNDKDMLYLNARTSWVKLASGIVKDDEPNIAQNNILYNGISSGGGYDGALRQKHSFESKYGYGPSKYGSHISEYGYQPMPGIVSADIRCMNRGSIKKATVQIKAFTPEQFHILDQLYLRIGYTMFLEWGHSIYLDDKGDVVNMGYTLIEADQGFFASTDYYQMLGKIEYYRKSKFGNYDGLICKVVNFNWHIAQDGSYDITLELISVGDVVESLKTNISPNKELADGIDQVMSSLKSEETDAPSQISPSSNIISAYLYFQHLLNKDSANYSKEKIFAHIVQKNDKLKLGHFIKLNHLPPLFKSNPEAGNFKTSTSFLSEDAARTWAVQTYPTATESNSSLPGPQSYTIQSTTQTLVPNVKGLPSTSGLYYVVYNDAEPLQKFKFGKVGQGERNVMFINYENPKENKNDSSTGYYMRFGHLLDFLDKYVVPRSKTDRSIKMVKIYSEQSLMYRHPYQYSADPRVCVVAIPQNEPINSKIFLVDEKGSDFDSRVQWKISKGGYSANSMNIYISHTQILQSLEANLDDKGNLSLFNFLKDICNALNRALCGLNNLEPVIDETDNILYIIDSSYHVKKSKTYELELYGYNNDWNTSNFVRNFNLKTEITPEFATMASIGATAAGYVKGTENTMFSRFNKGLIDRFQDEWHAPTSDTAKEAREDVLDLYRNKIWWGMWNAFGMIKKGTKPQLQINIIDRNVSIMTEFFKYIQSEQRNKKEKYASTQNGFIPISLGVTMDGISGIKIYNSLNVSTRFLPANYPENLVFIIKGVNHKLSNSDWETTLETVVVSKVDTSK